MSKKFQTFHGQILQWLWFWGSSGELVWMMSTAYTPNDVFLCNLGIMYMDTYVVSVANGNSERHTKETFLQFNGITTNYSEEIRRFFSLYCLSLNIIMQKTLYWMVFVVHIRVFCICACTIEYYMHMLEKNSIYYIHFHIHSNE